jgi:DNA-binding NarL/FixJ family response regulator
VRIAVADDAVLIREGLARLLTEAEFEVVGTAANGEALRQLVERRRPDVVIVDIKMPPTFTDEGLAAADAIRAAHPQIGVLVLSQYLEARYALRLIEQHPERVGYLLKDRVSDVSVLADAIRRVGEGECVVDPTIVSRLVRRRESGPLSELSQREREVLELMAEGCSNQTICAKLFLSPKTVEAHIRHVFMKLGLPESPEYHRRVVAVLTFLRGTGDPGTTSS